MAPNPEKGGALSPVPGALTDFMKSMLELTNDKMPDVVVHEYTPLLDSSDMGPPDWALLGESILFVCHFCFKFYSFTKPLFASCADFLPCCLYHSLANDIKANYLYFDGFVILMGTGKSLIVSSYLRMLHLKNRRLDLYLLRRYNGVYCNCTFIHARKSWKACSFYRQSSSYCGTS